MVPEARYPRRTVDTARNTHRKQTKTKKTSANPEWDRDALLARYEQWDLEMGELGTTNNGILGDSETLDNLQGVVNFPNVLTVAGVTCNTLPALTTFATNDVTQTRMPLRQGTDDSTQYEADTLMSRPGRSLSASIWALTASTPPKPPAATQTSAIDLVTLPCLISDSEDSDTKNTSLLLPLTTSGRPAPDSRRRHSISVIRRDHLALCSKSVDTGHLIRRRSAPTPMDMQRVDTGKRKMTLEELDDFYKEKEIFQEGVIPHASTPEPGNDTYDNDAAFALTLQRQEYQEYTARNPVIATLYCRGESSSHPTLHHQDNDENWAHPEPDDPPEEHCSRLDNNIEEQVEFDCASPMSLDQECRRRWVEYAEVISAYPIHEEEPPDLQFILMLEDTEQPDREKIISQLTSPTLVKEDAGNDNTTSISDPFPILPTVLQLSGPTTETDKSRTSTSLTSKSALTPSAVNPRPAPSSSTLSFESRSGCVWQSRWAPTSLSTLPQVKPGPGLIYPPSADLMDIDGCSPPVSPSQLACDIPSSGLIVETTPESFFKKFGLLTATSTAPQLPTQCNSCGIPIPCHCLFSYQAPSPITAILGRRDILEVEMGRVNTVVDSINFVTLGAPSMPDFQMANADIAIVDVLPSLDINDNASQARPLGPSGQSLESVDMDADSPSAPSVVSYISGSINDVSSTRTLEPSGDSLESVCMQTDSALEYSAVPSDARQYFGSPQCRILNVVVDLMDLEADDHTRPVGGMDTNNMESMEARRPDNENSLHSK
ncbi:hypothetical protein H0H87_005037 [Tephrocybe sp. NHM501043]|nr:hypothetical protein H0H87_005037 [Tephrocybe sp. NHM501043]